MCARFSTLGSTYSGASVCLVCQLSFLSLRREPREEVFPDTLYISGGQYIIQHRVQHPGLRHRAH
jgi:hypothetical protein